MFILYTLYFNRDKKDKPASIRSSKRERKSINPGIKDDDSPEEDSVAEPATQSGGGVIVTQTVGHYIDADGNKIWICPEYSAMVCGRNLAASGNASCVASSLKPKLKF